MARTDGPRPTGSRPATLCRSSRSGSSTTRPTPTTGGQRAAVPDHRPVDPRQHRPVRRCAARRLAWLRDHLAGDRGGLRGAHPPGWRRRGMAEPAGLAAAGGHDGPAPAAGPPACRGPAATVHPGQILVRPGRPHPVTGRPAAGDTAGRAGGQPACRGPAGRADLHQRAAACGRGGGRAGDRAGVRAQHAAVPRCVSPVVRCGPARPVVEHLRRPGPRGTRAFSGRR